MNYSLDMMFSLLNNDEIKKKQSELFNDFELSGSVNEISCSARHYRQSDINFVSSYFSRGFNVSSLTGSARLLFDISFNAFDIFFHSWLSELAVERETIAFGKKIIAVSDGTDNMEKKRSAAQMLISNILDADTKTALDASGKVHREVHRMMGLLRFVPDINGEFIAKCEPDHFILPSLGEYFLSRFGETAWSIIDEKRKLCLRRQKGKKIELFFINEKYRSFSGMEEKDEYEELWKHYHKTINNEDRDNPDLQRQFMPKRYWKYLPEV